MCLRASCRRRIDRLRLWQPLTVSPRAVRAVEKKKEETVTIDRQKNKEKKLNQIDDNLKQRNRCCSCGPATPARR